MKNNNKIDLTENEMNLIYDSMKGIWHDLTGTFWKYHIISGVGDAIYYRGLDKKWNVDKDILIKKLTDLTDLKMLDLMEMVMLFWGIEEESFTVFGTITLSQKRKEIISQTKN